MATGPVQIIVIGFTNTENFRGQIKKELDALRGRGILRIIDLIFVSKDANGGVSTLTQSDLNEEEQAKFGAMLGKIMGIEPGDGVHDADVHDMMAIATTNFGLGAQDAKDIANHIPNGTAAAVLLVEHQWAADLKSAVHSAGGELLAQGFLTPEALVVVGRELQATIEAEDAIEAAEIVKGAAELEILATVAEVAEVQAIADDIKTAIAAEVIRTLIAAELIQEAAAEEALEAVVAAEIIKQEALDSAVDAALAAAESQAALPAGGEASTAPAES
jgi:uncharacterized membrane protein